MGGFFSCGSNTCIANREGLCMDVLHMSPESCERYTVLKPQISNENKDLLESSTVNKPTRTELTVNEKIALELTRIWASNPVGYDTVISGYKEILEKLNKDEQK